VDRAAELIEAQHPQLSMRTQCKLLGVSRSSLGYVPVGESEEDTRLKRLLDELYLRDPCLGTRRLVTVLERDHGQRVNRKRLQRLRREMGVETIYCKPRTSIPDKSHRIYPYLLRDLKITRPDQVWCADITYVPMPRGHAYLCAVMDWHTRCVLGWAVSNTMDVTLCLLALDRARAGPALRARGAIEGAAVVFVLVDIAQEIGRGDRRLGVFQLDDDVALRGLDHHPGLDGRRLGAEGAGDQQAGGPDQASTSNPRVHRTLLPRLNESMDHYRVRRIKSGGGGRHGAGAAARELGGGLGGADDASGRVAVQGVGLDELQAGLAVGLPHRLGQVDQPGVGVDQVEIFERNGGAGQADPGPALGDVDQAALHGDGSADQIDLPAGGLARMGALFRM